MKIWMLETKNPSHRIIRLNCEEHSDFEYLGDLDDDELRTFYLKVQPDMDVEKNVKLLHYYGYLHLFIVNKKKEHQGYGKRNSANDDTMYTGGSV